MSGLGLSRVEYATQVYIPIIHYGRTILLPRDHSVKQMLGVTPRGCGDHLRVHELIAALKCSAYKQHLAS